MKKYLQVALEAAEAAAELIRTAYEESAFAVELKEDYSPVTEVDIATEKLIYEKIASAFPDHGFYGEEEGHREQESDFLWLVDPIDGTKAFIRRRPFFSTQIALMYQGELLLGVSSAPLYNGGEIAYALKGEGAYIGKRKLMVSDIDAFKDTVFSSGNLKTLAQDGRRWANYGELIRQMNSTRGFGDFLHYHLLASGSLDLIVESDVNILDIAALATIVREAGGIVTDLEGRPLTLATTSILAANQHLHGQALALINKE